MSILSKRNFLVGCVVTLLVCATSCNKKAVHKADEDFIGRWGHVENSNERWYLDIGDNSYGSITLYDSLNDFIETFGENPRRWRINSKIRILNLGFYTHTMFIDQYPAVATGEIVNGLDTILSGETYVILDGDYFVKY
jgi:hypothetical protein